MPIPVFDIVLPTLQDSDLQQSTLLIEIGERQVSFVWFKKNNRQLLKLQQFHFQGSAGWPPIDWLQDVLAIDPAYLDSIKEAIVVYNLPECQLIPGSSFNFEFNKPLIETLCGNAPKGLVLSEKIQGKDIYSIYRVPRELHGLIQKSFVSGKYWHFYSLLLQIGPNTTPGTPCIQAVFFQDLFVAAFYDSEGLKLLQTYSYQQPEDVSWILLHACQQFNIDSGSVVLELGGLIENNSALYKELEKYFGNIVWNEVSTSDWANEELEAQPLHYFSPILKMALCV